MAMSKTLVILGFVVVSMLWAGAMAQSSSSCTTVLISLSPCLNYITGNTSTPSSGCCTQLATIVKSQAQCLCEALNGGAASLGISVNQTRALALPADCSVTTPAHQPIALQQYICQFIRSLILTRLHSTNITVASPSSSPTGLAASPSAASSSGSGITTTTPTTDTGSSDGSSNKMSLKMIFSLSVVALCAMFSSI